MNDKALEIEYEALIAPVVLDFGKGVGKKRRVRHVPIGDNAALYRELVAAKAVAKSNHVIEWNGTPTAWLVIALGLSEVLAAPALRFLRHHGTVPEVSMKSAYRLLPDDAGWGRRCEQNIDASHDCYIPGVTCDMCEQTWAMTGVQYPTIPCAALEKVVGRLGRGTVSFEEYERIIAKVALIAEVRPLRPGTQFGPIRGTLQGEIADFNWLNPWTPLLSVGALSRIEEALGFTVVGRMAKLTCPPSMSDGLFEPEGTPTARTSTPDLDAATCRRCGRTPGPAPALLAVAGQSLASDVLFQRSYEFPTVLIVGEAVARIIEKLALSNVCLKPIGVL